MAKSVTFPTFKTAVWNLYGGTPIEQSLPALDDSLAWGCTLWIVCEAKGASRDKLFAKRGLETVAHDQVRVAWDPKRWRFDSEHGGRLSETNYFKKDGRTKVWSLGQFVTLTDLASAEYSLSLEVASYHTPSGVQVNKNRPTRRYQAFVESLLSLAARANETEADGFLSGGDDNWDEDGKNGKGGVETKDTEPIMLGRATGLRQIQAGSPTFGKREIDDYRILQLSRGGHIRPTGAVEVIDGRGAESPAHKIHMREWEWHGIDAVLKSVAKVAQEVIDGLWGNGDERRTRLTEAGYNYDEVQAKVSELLKPKLCPTCGQPLPTTN